MDPNKFEIMYTGFKTHETAYKYLCYSDSVSEEKAQEALSDIKKITCATSGSNDSSSNSRAPPPLSTSAKKGKGGVKYQVKLD